jgi:uncharacterized protein YcfJ
MEIVAEADMNGKRVTSVVLATALVPGVALARGGYDYAQVLSSDPMYQTVSYSVPVEQCTMQTVAYREPQHRSATPTILGAVIGGALGNAVGSGKRNKQVGAAVGAVLGGSIGNDIGRRHTSHGPGVRYANEQVCSTVYEERAEQRLTGYRVTYRYAGQTYATTMDRDPGSTLRVRVHVTPVG